MDFQQDIHNYNDYEDSSKFGGIKKEYRMSALISLFSLVVLGTSVSTLLPSLWPYLELLGLDHSDLSTPQAAYNLGWLIGAAFLGWSTMRLGYKFSLFFASITGFIGNILYATVICMNVTPNTALWILSLARFISGLADCYAVVTAYLSAIVPPENRTKVLAITEAIFSFSFVLGPAIEIVFSFINFNIGKLIINECTLAGYFCALLYFIQMLSLFFFNSTPPVSENYGFKDYEPYSVRIILILSGYILITIFIYAAILASETINSALTEKYYLFDTFLNSILWTCVGIGAVIGPFIVELLAEKISDSIQLCIFISILTISYTCLIDFGKPLRLGIFISANVIISTTSPAVKSLVNSLFSKILGSRPKGFAMSFLQVCAALSGLLTPIWVAPMLQIPSTLGPTFIFLIISTGLFISLVTAFILQPWTFVEVRHALQYMNQKRL
eukprot:TRINITY_DN8611_c0_g1_i1.p1 TRINITY_DN8611_c0_g1~~TRINITY_DN8611_c0_g1_i1.p1  ORF type:complete len:443 (-),score=104.94 TRINITY_DN8611_c0_g1_i1:40-1368(-)